MKTFYALGFLVFIIYAINERFANFFLITFSNLLGLSDNELVALLGKNQGAVWGSFVFMILPVYFWVSDFKKYIKNPSKDMRLVVRRKIENIYPSLMYFYLISFLSVLFLIL